MLNTISQWFTMGGYSLYIWPAYGVVCVVLVMHLLGLRRQRLKVKRNLVQWFKRLSR